MKSRNLIKLIRFVEDLLKIIHFAVKARERQEEIFDINPPRRKREFHEHVMIMHAGDVGSELEQSNLTLVKHSTGINEDVNYMGTADRGTHTNTKMNCNY